jgi:hypothetical protein
MLEVSLQELHVDSAIRFDLEEECIVCSQDILKYNKIAMSLVAGKTSADFSVIVRAQQTNKITREQAEYFLQKKYQMAMMQYQVLSALHDVLKHDIDEAAGQQVRQSLEATSSDTVLVVPFADSTPASR